MLRLVPRLGTLPIPIHTHFHLIDLLFDFVWFESMYNVQRAFLVSSDDECFVGVAMFSFFLFFSMFLFVYWSRSLCVCYVCVLSIEN